MTDNVMNVLNKWSEDRYRILCEEEEWYFNDDVVHSANSQISEAAQKQIEKSKRKWAAKKLAAKKRRRRRAWLRANGITPDMESPIVKDRQRALEKDRDDIQASGLPYKYVHACTLRIEEKLNQHQQLVAFKLLQESGMGELPWDEELNGGTCRCMGCLKEYYMENVNTSKCEIRLCSGVLCDHPICTNCLERDGVLNKDGEKVYMCGLCDRTDIYDINPVDQLYSRWMNVLDYNIRFYRAYNIVTQSKRELERIENETDINTAHVKDKIATITARIEKVKKAEEINLDSEEGFKRSTGYYMGYSLGWKQRILAIF
jgi:hypothetical protein